MANDKDPMGLFEDDRDAAGELVLSEIGVKFGEVVKDNFKEISEEAVAKSHDELTEVFDAYMDQEVRPMIEDSVADLRKLMLLAISEIGGPDALANFIKKVGALARAGALSSQSGEWAAAGPDDSAENHQTVAGGGSTLRREAVEANERAVAAKIFNEVVADMDDDGKALMEDLAGDLIFDGDENRLKRQLELIRNQQVPSPLTENYVKAIARTVRR
jgi:hypothetical protein